MEQLVVSGVWVGWVDGRGTCLLMLPQSIFMVADIICTYIGYTHHTESVAD